MNLHDAKIEKLILLTTILFGLILFIDYVFGISNIIHAYDKNIDKIHFNRNIFLHLYSVSLIPVLSFYGLCSFNRNISNKSETEPEILINFIQPFFTFVLGYYTFMFLENLKIDLRIVIVIIIQFLFFTTISNIFLLSFKWLINKWIDNTKNWKN